MRLEGWATGACSLPTLRDGRVVYPEVLEGRPPQGEAIGWFNPKNLALVADADQDRSGVLG